MPPLWTVFLAGHQCDWPKAGSLEGALRNSVHTIESKLGEFDEPLLLVKMLMMRHQARP